MVMGECIMFGQCVACGETSYPMLLCVDSCEGETPTVGYPAVWYNGKLTVSLPE